MAMTQNETLSPASTLLWLYQEEEAEVGLLGGSLGSTLQGSETESPHLFHVGFGHIDVSVHLLEVLLGAVSLLAVPLEAPLTLQTEHSQAVVIHPLPPLEGPPWASSQNPSTTPSIPEVTSAFVHVTVTPL